MIIETVKRFAVGRGGTRDGAEETLILEHGSLTCHRDSGDSDHELEASRGNDRFRRI